MTKEEIQKHFDEILGSLEQKKIKNSFGLLGSLVSYMQNWPLYEQLNSLEKTYQTMLRYFTENVPDPQRDQLYDHIIKSLYQIADTAILQIRTSNDNSFFYEKRRSYHYYHTETSEQLFSSIENVYGKLSLLSLLDEEQNTSLKDLEQQKEMLFQKVFHRVWLSDQWNDIDKDNWSNLINNQLDPIVLPSLILSGITLNLLEMFDEKKALTLFEAAFNSNEEVRERALTGIVLFLRKYNDRLYLYPSIDARLKQLMEDPKFVYRIRHIILQFILSRETEKITRKITDELLPEMMKFGPKFNKIKQDELLNETGIDEKNPEWQKIIEEAGIKDKLQELTELQMEGADVMHSSFVHLKSYPFFNEITNWFLPFYTPHDSIGNKELERLVSILENSTVLCNSDKYSFYLSVSQMPENYRKAMMAQFSNESDAIKEALKEDLNNESKTIDFRTRQYIHDLYRFYKLHPKRKDFVDIFDTKPEFYKAPSIYQIIKDDESLLIIGEYYFNKNYFTEAADVFGLLMQSETDNHILYQKRGYCFQMMGYLEKALDCYLKAELLDTNNPWLLKKLAYCYRMLKNPKEALHYYKKTEQLNPDNLMLQLSIGHCFLELKEYDQALKYYFKVEYLSRNKEKSQRPIAWCFFLMGKYEQAMDYYNRLIENNPASTDYLNAGHVQWAMGNNKQAIQFYRSSLEASHQSPQEFIQIFSNDIPDLIRSGIQKKDIPLILDSLLYEI